MPNISIVTPTYNRLELLKRLKKSIFEQTYKDFTWIIVDDGSTDGTEEYFSKLEGEYKGKIKYVTKENGGVNSARNFAINHIETKFVTFIDSDDFFINTQSLAIICENIKHAQPDVGVVKFLIRSMGEIKRRSKINDNVVITSYENEAVCEIDGEFLSVFRTQVFEKHKWPKYNGFEIIFFLEVAKCYKSMYFNESVLFADSGNDNLTGVLSVINRSESLIPAVDDLIDNNANYWKENCPEMIFKWLCIKCFYSNLNGKKKISLNTIIDIIKYIKYGTISKLIISLIMLILPSKLNKILFLLKHKRGN